jgi:ABC-type transporter Mla MlaB component
MFKAEIRKSGKKQLLQLGGNLVIDHIEDIRKVFLDALSRSQTLEIQFETIDKIDFSFLQLLGSIERSAQKKKRKIVLEKLPGPLLKAVESAGFSHLPLLPAANGQ